MINTRVGIGWVVDGRLCDVQLKEWMAKW
ncbi:hypothetical protein CPAR01_15132 [Colletotrichum paranaense]|uniref:Uncharacterized protein n=2 Tax=Colletotrichum acutatum species complex TaxID=2707335 RepID=A0AAI9UCQ1_9PEZI|nr:hypothetical protein CMEL01_16643 [Colletotrichum melonis]KAK1520081.1 hypothetical protein CPAR01_15132 [Colletotrichum paranaense]